MADRKYSDLNDNDQLRVNAVLLAALKNDQPEGLTRTMRERLVGNVEPSTAFRLTGGILGTHDTNREPNFEKGQAFLTRMRDTLAALPMSGEGKAIPDLSGTIHKPDDSLRVQRGAFKSIISAMIKPVEPGAQLEVAAIDFGASKNIDSKLVYAGNVNDLALVKAALTNFRAVEEVAACQENAKNAPSACKAPVVPAKGAAR